MKKILARIVILSWKKLMVLSCILLVLIMLFAGCANKIKTVMLCPGKAHEAANLRRIAVLPFAGRGGGQVTADVEALLVGTRVNGDPYFNVIERVALDKIMKEQFLQLTGAVDEKTAVSVGKLVGAEGVILGSVTQSTTEDKRFSVQRSKCVSRDSKGKCKSWRKYSVSCTTRDAYFSFTPKVVSVTTGQIVASEILTGHYSDSVCRDSGRPLHGRREMLAEAQRLAIEKFRELIAPYYVNVEIVLLEKDDTHPPSMAREKVKLGVEWAKNGRLDRACKFWHEAYKLHPEGYAIHYLLGVCAETGGNFQGALSYYEKADRMTGKPVKEINEALVRIRVRLEKEKRLEQQLQR